jgi:WD40 repeat protein
LATDYNAVLASSPESGATHLLYLREDALFAQAFDAEKARLRGEPVRLTDHVARFGNFGYFGASASGALVYRTGGEALASFYQAAWLDRQGVRVNASTKGDFNMLALSPDDGRLAIVRVDHSSGKSGQSDIWSLDLTRKTFTRLTFEGGTNPVWSPDGKLVAYTSSKAAGDGIYRRPSDGSGTEEELLAPGKARRIVNNWSRDGRFLLYSQSKSDTNYDLWLLPISPGVERKPALFLGTDRDEVQGQISPDSRWVAYVSDESGRPEVYVQPLPGTGGKGKWLVSNDGGLMPRWRRDGRELYYLQNQALTSVSIDAGGVFHAGEPHAITITPFRINSTPVFRWDVTADGKRFIGSSYADTEDTASTSPITVVLNWAAGLKR